MVRVIPQVYFAAGGYACAGSVLTPRHVLTAAHCLATPTGELHPPGDCAVVAGAHVRPGSGARYFRAHRYPQHFFKFLTLPLTVVCYKVNYLPAGVRIWFWPNCGIRVFGDMANFSSEIG